MFYDTNAITTYLGAPRLQKLNGAIADTARTADDQHVFAGSVQNVQAAGHFQGVPHGQARVQQGRRFLVGHVLGFFGHPRDKTKKKQIRYSSDFWVQGRRPR